MGTSASAVAVARANIALVKYWGKRDDTLNLPAAGSLSLTLEGLETRTRVTLGGAAMERDRLVINGEEGPPAALARARRVLDAVRAVAGEGVPAMQVESSNSFPTSAGLASSASGMAALAAAAARAMDLELPLKQLSAIARLGSGSACRSIFGGFVQWNPGVRSDGSDSHGEPLFPEDHWDLRVVVVVVDEEPKQVWVRREITPSHRGRRGAPLARRKEGAYWLYATDEATKLAGMDRRPNAGVISRRVLSSNEGMELTAASSPYHQAWIESVAHDLAVAREAIRARDLAALGLVAERSCLRMHANMSAAEPPLVYLGSGSWRVIEEVRRLQAAGVPAFFTADAGPNIKVFCAADAEAGVQAAMAKLGCVRRIIKARPGAGVTVEEG